MNQHTILQKDKTTTGCAPFSLRDHFSMVIIFEGFKERRGGVGINSYLMLNSSFGILENTVDWTLLSGMHFTICGCPPDLEIGASPFYIVSDNENHCAKSDARVNRVCAFCPWHNLLPWFHLIYRNIFFLMFFFFLLFLLKAKNKKQITTLE